MTEHASFLGAGVGAVSGRGRVTILGAPLDLTESFRAGTASAPQIIRKLSDSLETYSPGTDRDLREIGLVDAGDIPLEDIDMAEALRRIQSRTRQAVQEGLVILLGGEHTVTLGAARALREHHQNLAVIMLDAHLDLLDEYLGVRVGHACVARRLVEEIGHHSIVQLGVRSGLREEFSLAKHNLLASGRLALPNKTRLELERRPIYLSIDIDVLDPAFAPGTGYPEPGGPSFVDILELLYSLKGLNVVAADVVEVLPDIDPAGITALAAAKLVREVAALFG